MLLAISKRITLAATLFVTLAATPAAQGTTGVPGINDYTLNGMIPGSSSCTLLFPFPSGPAVLNVSTAPGAPVVFMFNLNCPCRACLLPWPAAGGCGLPPLVCAASNHAFELDTSSFGCVFLTATATADSSGNATLTVPFPPLIRVATQAVLLHPCNTASPPLVFTQAYQISTV